MFVSNHLRQLFDTISLQPDPKVDLEYEELAQRQLAFAKSVAGRRERQWLERLSALNARSQLSLTR